jgi:hypothetical protein
MSGKNTVSALIFLGIGIVLSFFVALPSIITGTTSLSFGIIFNIILILALISPFLVLFFQFKNSDSKLYLFTFGILFCFCHLWFIYLAQQPQQEFGYIGFIFFPILEVILALPVALILFCINRLRKSNGA